MKGDKCSYNDCDKEAIGYQYTDNMGLNVCEDHCVPQMKKLKSDERKNVGSWTLKRY
jgi:hypothetical protein